MWIENETFKEDLEAIANASFIDWQRFAGKTILVTGATGLIGFNFVSGVLYANRKWNLGLKVIALVRNLEKAHEKFAAQLQNANDLEFVIGSVENVPTIDGKIDYIMHGASQTASKAFVQQPVETIMTAVNGTVNMLNLAKENKVEGFVYLSSMEVYGHPAKGHKVKESDAVNLEPLSIRNSYPIAKAQCENLCLAYASEYGVPASIARLTQTFGAGIDYNDGRIFAEFARCAIEKRNIVLKTTGETERCYLYTADAVTAIVKLLLDGKPGQAYNVADEKSYCSIAEMAKKVAEMNDIQVVFDLQDNSKTGYPDPVYMDLDTDLLQRLGWKVNINTFHHLDRDKMMGQFN